MPSKLTLQIDANEASQGWRAQWSRDDQPIGGPITVHDQAAKAMADSGRRFLELFEQDGPPLVDPEDLFDAKIVEATPQAKQLGIKIGMTGRDAVELLLAASARNS